MAKRSGTYHLGRDWALLSAFVVLVASIGYFAVVFADNSAYVPKEFFEARVRGAEISEKIVKLTGVSMGNLREIGRLDEMKEYSAGVELVLAEIKRNDESRKSALALSEELGNMARVIADVKPAEASEIALQAILYESQIVQRLINHNNYLYQLLDFLRSRFLNDTGASNKMVSDLLSQMNAEIASINELNEKYKEAMAKFDALTQEEEKE